MCPASEDDIVGIRRVKIKEIRIGVSSHYFGHKTYLRIRLDVVGKVRVKDAVDNSPIVDWIASRIFRVGICATKFDGWIAWSSCKEVMRPGFEC